MDAAQLLLRQVAEDCSAGKAEEYDPREEYISDLKNSLQNGNITQDEYNKYLQDLDVYAEIVD